MYDISKNVILFRNINLFSERSISFAKVQPLKIDFIEELIRTIPYKINGSDHTEKTLPIERYNYTIVNGYGNCSQLAFGTSYLLLKEAKEFYILHFFPKDTWREGYGHTAILVRINNDLVIVDMLEGGVVFNLDQDNLFRAEQSVDFLSYNSLKDSINPYFPNVFQSNVGIIESNSVRDYFQFIEKIYIPLGNDQIEKYLYNGLSLFLGHYPRIYIDNKSKLVTTFENFRFQFYLLWFRVLITSLAILFLRRLFLILSKKNVWNNWRCR